jgi:hypothetical protein
MRFIILEKLCIKNIIFGINEIKQIFLIRVNHPFLQLKLFCHK